MATKKRTTFSVAKVLSRANYFLEHSKPEHIGERKATHSMMKSILMDTGNYRGFNYLGMTDNPIFGKGPIIPDESRTFFYVDANIVEEYKSIEQERKANGF